LSQKNGHGSSWSVSDYFDNTHGDPTPFGAGYFAKAHIMNKTTKLILIGVLALLAACGRREPERVQGAAAAGAATGATVGLVGGPPGVVVGAVIGGGAGAIAGASTSPRQVDLGRPIWKQP
jgi:hypothetical protein